MIADASTAIFTITAGGQTKTVNVYALGTGHGGHGGRGGAQGVR